MTDVKQSRSWKAVLRGGCGCGTLLLVLAVWAIWQMGEPQRRAQAAMEAIRPGMRPSEVLALFPGRIVVQYDVHSGEGYAPVTREAFFAAVEPTAGEPSASGQLRVHVLGSAPGRIAVVVRFGPDGLVSEMAPPERWD